MKYPEEMYIDSQIFAGDMDGSESNLTEKIVKIRVSHLCCVCEKQVPKGERMLNQKAIVEGQGWRSCYICLPCVENWLPVGWWNAGRKANIHREIGNRQMDRYGG